MSYTKVNRPNLVLGTHGLGMGATGPSVAVWAVMGLLFAAGAIGTLVWSARQIPEHQHPRRRSAR